MRCHSAAHYEILRLNENGNGRVDTLDREMVTAGTMFMSLWTSGIRQREEDDRQMHWAIFPRRARQ